jgi:MFS family permease
VSELPVVVIGAGPEGLATAAHLLERGFEPLVLEAGDGPASAVSEWGHVRLFSPWPELVDKAAERLLTPTGWTAPAAGYPTGAEWISRVTEIVSYGVIYYAFPVLAAQITAGTGWSRTAVTAAYSAGEPGGRCGGYPGRAVPAAARPARHDDGGQRAGAAALAGIAAAPSYWWFVVAWLAAGFASTTFAPLTSALTGQLSWRAVYLILAAVLASVTIPAHALALRPPRPPRLAQRAEPARASPRSGKTASLPADRHVLASRAFLQLVTAAALCAFAQYAALVNLVPLLTGRGLSPGLAAWALGLGGAGQVVGRLCYGALDARTGARGRATAIIAAAAVTLLLGLLPGPAAPAARAPIP